MTFNSPFLYRLNSKKMKNNKLSKAISAILILSGIMLFVILFVPMWRIDLDAPQYPEGLRLLIYANKLGGNVDIINGLNHYIGMKTLHADDFVEFKILPYIIVFFGLFFIATGFSRNRKWLYTLFTFFVIFGIVAMADFWKWEYDYGHNLNPEAAIIVPGMAYQPPLIGFKQLLNFGAFSVPDIGGWLFIIAGSLALFCIVVDKFKMKKVSKLKVALVILLIASTASACNVAPQPIKLGSDNCSFCKMTISNPRFGAEILTNKGKTFKYDDLVCLISGMNEMKIAPADIKTIYSVDFCGTHNFIDVKSALFLKSSELKSPMAGNLASFSNQDSLNYYNKIYPGEIISWETISK